MKIHFGAFAAALVPYLSYVNGQGVDPPVTLQITSPYDFLNNSYISVSRLAPVLTSYYPFPSVGLYPNYTISSACTTFSRYVYAPTGTSGFRRCGTNEDLALIGLSDERLDLVSADSPSNKTIPQAMLMEWATFTLGGENGNEVGVEDGTGLTARRWIAYESLNGSYNVALYNGASPPSKTYYNVSILVVPVMGAPCP